MISKENSAPSDAKCAPVPRRGRLFWRIYRHGVLVLLSTAALLSLLAWLVRDASPWARTPTRIAAALEQELLAARANPTRLQARLDHLSTLMHMDLAVYSRMGEPLAQATVAPLDPVPAAELAGLDGPRHIGFGPTHAAPVGPDAYVVTRWRGGGGGLFPVAVVGLLCLLALLSWPLARKIARPLERIAATARALGEGDLSARTGVTGRGEEAELARTIDEMAARLARLRTHERTLLAHISHELRTPLARIRVGLEWAEEEGALPPPLAGLGTDLVDLESLVEDVLATARLDLEEGGFVLRREATRTSTLAEAALARFRQAHPAVPVAAQVADGEVACDPRLIGRVLSNLLDNAARHGQGPVELVVERADGGFLVAVLDRGPGVQPADLPRLFDPFFRTDASRTRATGGIGLGLTLCQRAVQAHGGTLEATVREGGGMRFQFRLPA